MKITVKKLNGSSCDFELDKNALVRDLKEAIHRKENVDAHLVRLMFEGVQLDSDHHLKDYNITEESSVLFSVRKNKKLVKHKQSDLSDSVPVGDLLGDKTLSLVDHSNVSPASLLLPKSAKAKFRALGKKVEKNQNFVNAFLDLKSGVSRPQQYKQSNRVSNSDKNKTIPSVVSPKPKDDSLNDVSDQESTNTRPKSNTKRLKINDIVFADESKGAMSQSSPTKKVDTVITKKDDSSKVENSSYVSEVSLLTIPSQLGSVDDVTSVYSGTAAHDMRYKRIHILKQKLAPKKHLDNVDLEEAYHQRIETKIKSKLMTISPINKSQQSGLNDLPTSGEDKPVTDDEYFERIENKLKRAGILTSDLNVNLSSGTIPSTIKKDSDALDSHDLEAPLHLPNSLDTIGFESSTQNKVKIEPGDIKSKQKISSKDFQVSSSMKSKSISAITIPESRSGFMRRYKSTSLADKTSSKNSNSLQDTDLLSDDLNLIYRALVQVRRNQDDITVRKDVSNHGSKSSYTGKSFRNRMKARLRKAGEDVSSDEDEQDEVEKNHSIIQDSSESSADEKSSKNLPPTEKRSQTKVSESFRFTDDRRPNDDGVLVGELVGNVSLAVQNNGAGNYLEAQTAFVADAGLSTPMKAELYDDDVVMGEIIDEDLEYSNAKEQRLRFLNRLACIVITIVAIFIAVFVPVGQTLYDVSQRTNMPSVAPSTTPSLTPSARPSSTRFSDFALALSNANVTSMEMFLDQTSFQYKALQWIADEDNIDIFAPNMIQRYVLAVFYYALNGDNWHICSGNSNETCGCAVFGKACMTIEEFHVPQLSSVDECLWYRHKCDEDGWVTHMLYGTSVGNNLEGQIPTEINHLEKLQVLDLQNNKISGTLPDSFGNLKNLRDFAINRNRMSGTIPESLFETSSLQNLELRGNSFSGSLSSKFGQLSSLRRLVVDGNNFFDRIPSEFGRLRQLRELTLWNNDLSGDFPTEIFQLPSLRVIEVRNNNLSGEISVESLLDSNLRNFSFANNSLSGTIPEAIFSARRLRSINLANNMLTGNLSEQFKKLDLLYLQLHNNQLSGLIPSALAGNSSLAIITLHGNSFSGHIPSSICDIEGLLLSADCMELNCTCCYECY